MPSSAQTRTPWPWSMPVGLPADGTLQIGVKGLGVSSGRIVTAYPFCRNAHMMCLFEAGGYEAATWINYARSTTYQFDSDGTKTLYVAYRNPARQPVLGDPADEAISAIVTIDTSAPNGLIDQMLEDIVTILRADSTLQGYTTGDQTWNSTDDPHVIPGWRSEEPALSAEGNRGRMPFLEIRAGPSPVLNEGPGTFRFAATYQIRAYMECGVDVATQARESAMNKFLWDIMDALNVYPRLLGNPAVIAHGPANLDPTAHVSDDGALRVGRVDLNVRAIAALQNYNDS